MAPSPSSVSSPFPLQATSGQSRFLSEWQPGSSPASLDSFLAGRQGLPLTPSKPVSLIAKNNQQGPHLGLPQATTACVSEFSHQPFAAWSLKRQKRGWVREPGMLVIPEFCKPCLCIRWWVEVDISPLKGLH